MRIPWAFSALLLISLLVHPAARAQEDSAATQETQAAATEPTSKPAPKIMSIIQTLPDYTGDLAHRSVMTGDWGGARTELANHGILFEGYFTQNLQGNAHGGKNTKGAFEYGGSADYWLKLDTARMGLWPGGLIVLHGETQIGQSVNGNTGSFMSPNFKALLPEPGEPGLTTLSEYYIMQALSEKFVMFAGKLDLTAVADRNAFAGDTYHTTQFMNTAFNVNPVLFTGGPYTTLGAGAMFIPTDWFQMASFVAQNNPDAAATVSGFDTVFSQSNQTTVGQEYDFTLKPFGKVGHQRLGWFYTNKNFVEFEGDSRIPFPVRRLGVRGIPGRLLPRPLRRLRIGNVLIDTQNPQQRADNYAMYYNFDQYLFTEGEDPTQGWGLFGRFGLAPSTSNLFNQFYSLGIGGKGTIPTRDRDTWGLGYYLGNVDNNIGSKLGLSSEQGVELYYSIEVTPWFHLTPDLQVIVDPAGGFDGRDVSIVYGLRGRVAL